MSLLDLRDITASYGASQALFGVTLALEEGEVLALMGRNGMGKSTTLRCLCGLMPSGGVRRFAGQDLARLPAHRIARLGVGLVPEGRRCFRDLSVTENLLAAARPGAWDQARVELLFPRLAERRGQKAATLSGGEQQMLAIGRALMTNPRLLVLDEATEGLAPLVRQEIWDALLLLKRGAGLSILVVDKSLREMAAVADRAVILERGTSVWSGAFADLGPAEAERYLGV
ncbi:ABC transporter ATP-binding protein [Salipiger marinus]|jgi:branched-chain amino acid transport system ATP-binding protein|uniref:ABC transporter ATP-binding protein n=1 Tax=Salipiger marinus TaxID=555512 RepID=UPI000E97401A|nr:ABC transporter ATP-binding protein [Salipiger manganoxidans]MCD1617254.1 ABC transporter ATP-binding protein [Salipiger manganoxidans]MEB3417301.1 ABC transporter ATP-binding protein [Salipiger manganoxidans]HBM61420.1 ABC transporter ATP-binding protein [Citreicella sp.]HBT01448.1 ABC transporter ATP-binding protein [Citreicella sp.]|tara:strand:+ start:227 stop:913 length:687 start_codon:yes stop_codon:yes gene_type:complete